MSAMTADVTCKITVGPEKVTLEIDSTVFEAPIMHTSLMESIVRRLDRFVSHHPSGPIGCERDDLALLGTVLFQILFGGKAGERIKAQTGSTGFVPLRKELGQLLTEKLDAFVQRQQGTSSAKFRISLTFNDDASSFGNYPWEFLFVEKPNGRGFFLGERATLIRAVSPMLKIDPSSSLNVLVAWAQPQELGPLQGASDLAASIKQKLDGCVHDVESLTNATWRCLSDYLGENSPDILHIIAHGRLTEKGGELAFLRTSEEMEAARADAALAGLGRTEDVGEANWIAVSNLAAQLQARPPRLVFLHACNSGRANPGVEAFRGAAENIARAGVPFVVAMQYEIANEDAEIFVREFYATIASPHASVDDAVRAGRAKLGTQIPAWSHRRFATPVVYLHNENAYLIAAQDQTIAPAPSPQAEIFQTCPFDQCTATIKAEGKFCGCNRRNRLAFCSNGHANRPDEEDCWRKGCDARVLQPRTAAAPPARSPPQAGDA